MTFPVTYPIHATSLSSFPRRREALFSSRTADHPGTLPLGPLPIAIKAKAFAFGELLFFACARALQEQRRTAKPPEGRGTGMCRVKESNQKKRFTAAERLIKHTPPARPQLCCGSAEPAGFFDATRPLCGRALGIRRAANARLPGRSSASPFSGEPMHVALRVFPATSAASEGPRRSDIRRPWRLARRRARRCCPSRARSRATATTWPSWTSLLRDVTARPVRP